MASSGRPEWAKDLRDAAQILRPGDAITPSAIPLPDRAARRLCDRLVEPGAVRELTVRELTVRDSFRLYGV